MAYLDHTPAAQAASRAVYPFTLDLEGCDGYWPQNALQAFTLRMASHGLCVSSSMMLGDRRYALEQLSHAHAMADEALQGLAMELFHHFERQQSGLLRLS